MIRVFKVEGLRLPASPRREGGPDSRSTLCLLFRVQVVPKP